MATPQKLISYDAQQALTEFSLEFDGTLVALPADEWARQFGTVVSGKFRKTLPIGVSAPGFVERIGDDRMRKLFSVSLSFEPKEYEDGVEELRSVIEAPDFIGWSGEPARIAIEASRNPNLLVAAILEANPLLDLYRRERPGGSVASAVNLFHATHPVNIFDDSFSTQSNLIAQGTYSDFGYAMVSEIKRRFAIVKAPNGKPMGLTPTHVLVPPARIQSAVDFFGRDMVIYETSNGVTTQKNLHAGTITPVRVDEFTDDDYTYWIDAASGCKPWAVQDGGTPEEIRYDLNSDYYKNTGKVGVKYILTQGAAAAMPHAIMRVDLKSSSR